MQTINAKNYYEILKKQADRLLPEAEYNCMISPAKQQKEIEHLKNTLHYERFFFVVNNYDLSIDYVHGIKKWLGYSDKDFSYYRYVSIIHPTHLLAQLTNVYGLLEDCMAGVYPLEFMAGLRFISCLALKHANGEYLFFKRLALPFQFDRNNRLLSYLNEFTLLGKFRNENYSVRLTDAVGNAVSFKKTKCAYPVFKNLPFSEQELNVLGVYAADTSLTAAGAAEILKIKENTVITYKKRILNKAEKMFHCRFRTTTDVAVFLKEQGLI